MGLLGAAVGKPSLGKTVGLVGAAVVSTSCLVGAAVGRTLFFLVGAGVGLNLGCSLGVSSELLDESSGTKLGASL